MNANKFVRRQKLPPKGVRNNADNISHMRSVDNILSEIWGVPSCVRQFRAIRHRFHALIPRRSKAFTLRHGLAYLYDKERGNQAIEAKNRLRTVSVLGNNTLRSTVAESNRPATAHCCMQTNG